MIITRFFYGVNRFLEERLFSSFQFVNTFGWIATIGFPFFLVLYWDTEVKWTNIVGTLLGISVLIINRIKVLRKKLLPIVWFAFVIFFFPFDFSLGLFYQPDNISYALGEMLMLMVMIIVINDIPLLLISLGLGTYFALAVYSNSFINLNLSFFLDKSISLYILGIIFGVALSRKKDHTHKEELRAMYTLANSISHEINTPLSVIKSTADEASEKNWLQHSRSISEECSAASNIISILLVNAQTNDIEKKYYRPISIYTIIDRALTRYPYGYHKTFDKQQICWKKNQDDFKFNGIDLLMEHVLLNLLKNAIHAIVKKGGGSITIWNTSDKHANYLHIKDTGIGIRPEHKRKLFNSFFTTDKNGTGLGLHFCKKTLDQFGGKISFTSIYTQYTQFTIKLPVISEVHNA